MTNKYMTDLVQKIRSEEVAAEEAQATLSTGEGLMVLLAAGTADTLRLLAQRGDDLSRIWWRIGAQGRAFVLRTWEEDAA
jgi:hypothetical protein